ncbi:Fc.00g087810.m01.CDS01 [Cosmosporella sp. VM-42]
MGPLDDLISQLDEEIQDPEEGAETFLLYSQDFPSQNLGFVAPKSSSIEVEVGGRDYTIYQSPTVLSSKRKGGTTGAVLWKITPSFAAWLSTPSNPLFTTTLLTQTSAILELGSGISPLNALSLSRVVSRYILTDQPYVHKLIQRNIETNLPQPPPKRGLHHQATAKIEFRELDWETDEATPALTGSESVRSFDVVLACDCVFNYALAEPFVQTCVDACKLRAKDGERDMPCVCIVAQQLRNDEVFKNWLERFHEDFRVWRVPDESLPEELRTSVGFVVHIGVLRESRQ